MPRKKVDFVNHHVHSHFSTLDGLSTPQEIVQRVVDLGQKSISITDHGSMSGIPQMYQAARDADITFTPGCEMYFATDRTLKSPDRIGEKYYHLILLAYNNEGYANLSKLQTIAWDEGYYYKPRIDYSALEEHSSGLTVTTSCLGGIVNQYLMRGDISSAEQELAHFVDIFGKENTYVELQNHGIDEQLKILGAQRDLAKKFGLKMIATTDSHYCTHDECDVHDSLLCTGTKAQKTDTKRFKFESDQNYLHSGEQMLELFPEEDFPGAVSNTMELAEKTEFSMNMGAGKKYLMPITGTGKKTDDEVLRENVLSGAANPMRYGDSDGKIPEEVIERIDYELSVIKRMKFASYFLIVQNIISTLAKHGIITGPGRGCLHPATPILTPDGWLPISAMTPGDQVLTETGAWGKVADVKCHVIGADEPLVTVTTSQGESLSLTTKHKVLVSPSDNKEDRDALWLSAAQLEIGEHSIVSTDEHGHCTYHDVINVESLPADVDEVYDLAIDNNSQPSFMTNAGIVHNSAPGSVVVYCLGIVDVDPLEHGLLFERFLNPDRVSMPDIDIDIPKSRRKEALEIVEQEYGKGHVAHLTNYNKMGMRDALLRAAKVYGMAPSEANKFRDVIATWCEDHGESLLEFSRRGKPPAEVDKELPATPHYNVIVTTAAKFIGRVMGNGVHASGILITDTPLDDNFPIRVAKNNPLPVCQYDGTDTESIGGVKFDLLGLINLDECEDTERNILLDLGEEVDSAHVPYDDPEVYELLSHGEGGGVFQLGCVAGSTIVDGERIDRLYKLRNSALATSQVRSVFMGKGRVDFHDKENIVHSGVKDTVTVTTKHGNQLTCTPEHHVWTHRGWVKAGELRPDSDKVMIVPDNFLAKYGVRGLEDIIDLFLEDNPEWERYEGVSPVMVGGKSFYPHAVSPQWDYAYFYPDENYRAGVKNENFSYQYLNMDGTRIMQVKSYTEVVEDYVANRGKSQGILSPLGCEMSVVTSVEDAGKQDTYDIMMAYPVNNFIANGIVTHNSSGIQSLLRHMQPSEFKNIPALLALYRPGPMGMGTHDEYCERKNGNSPMQVLHPDMEQVVEENYDLIIYQEDIMHLARLMAGYTGGQADDLRKAMAKKDPAMMEKHHKMFVPAINEKYGDNLGQKLWDIIEPFGSYAFNRSHSVAYGYITYRTAWLKAHYPAQFSGAVIDQRMSNHDEIFETVSWIKKLGVTVHAPDLQRSEMRSVTDKDSIYLPLHIIKGLGEKKAQEIVDERESGGDFTSVVDVVSRCKLNESTIVNLAKSGGFDSFGVARTAVIAHAGDIVSLSKSHSSVMEMKTGLFGDMVESSFQGDDLNLEDDVEYVKYGDDYIQVDQSVLGRWERETMGVLLGVHPYQEVRESEKSKALLRKYPPVDSFTSAHKEANFSGFIHNISNRTSKRGNPFSSFVLETDSGMVPALRFSQHIDPSCEGIFAAVTGEIINDSSDGDGDNFTPKALCSTIRKVDVSSIFTDRH